MNIEKGVKIEGYSDYLIFPEEGKIWSLKRNKFIGSPNESTGYWQVSLTDDEGEKWKTSIHRVIYESVYGKIPEGMDVNHINEDKNNNSITNLNLMTRKENINFGTRTARAAEKQSKQVGAYKDGVLVMVFSSTAETGRQGYNLGAVAACCRGERQSHKNYQWRYIS